MLDVQVPSGSSAVLLAHGDAGEALRAWKAAQAGHVDEVDEGARHRPSPPPAARKPPHFGKHVLTRPLSAQPASRHCQRAQSTPSWSPPLPDRRARARHSFLRRSPPHAPRVLRLCALPTRRGPPPLLPWGAGVLPAFREPRPPPRPPCSDVEALATAAARALRAGAPLVMVGPQSEHDQVRAPRDSHSAALAPHSWRLTRRSPPAEPRRHDGRPRRAQHRHGGRDCPRARGQAGIRGWRLCAAPHRLRVQARRQRRHVRCSTPSFHLLT